MNRRSIHCRTRERLESGVDLWLSVLGVGFKVYPAGSLSGTRSFRFRTFFVKKDSEGFCFGLQGLRVKRGGSTRVLRLAL